MSEALELHVFKPSGILATHVQGVWSCAVDPNAEQWVDKWLYGDACSGILFNLTQDIELNQVSLPVGAYWLPVGKEAHRICLPPGAKLAGIRLKPGRIASLCNATIEHPTPMASSEVSELLTQAFLKELVRTEDHARCITLLCQKVIEILETAQPLPSPLLDLLQQDWLTATPQGNEISQRQTERLFKAWLGMTPKEYQRILRVRTTLDILRDESNAELADLAVTAGFSDQAHMTRELNKLAKVTPGQYRKRMKDRKLKS